MSSIADDLALALHDRLTRGQPLSADERAALEHWYEGQDSAEMAVPRQVAVTDWEIDPQGTR